MTPRQIAEKALAAPKEAAASFRERRRRKWFADNGWTYPVQGPSATGVGGVQQFFEALGPGEGAQGRDQPTAPSPFRGNVGQSVQATLEVKTQEKRPVFGHAVCDQPWLDVSRIRSRAAATPLYRWLVPRIPNRPGETLQAIVTVTSNGNQKFKVPVSLEIAGTATYRVVGLDDERAVAANPGGASHTGASGGHLCRVPS